jgi:hypothetical protein
MKIKTSAYDALGNLLPEQTYTVASSFFVDSITQGNSPPLVLGIWTACPDLGPGRVEPIYLTEEQRAAITIQQEP